ncbi:hypothetical protein HPB50_002027 [Hyalomma asiaticum]|uniref:Uncharacterized protein n=1 Tax=Hyalomma asiaticum TaxID=266040 RepID=A0ACB7TBJ3_HYAAI|nr:hypothetical protein HPB50_002027 [Hyalomma asiaticum]
MPHPFSASATERHSTKMDIDEAGTGETPDSTSEEARSVSTREDADRWIQVTHRRRRANATEVAAKEETRSRSATRRGSRSIVSKVLRASKMPRLPRFDIKVLVRPKDGLDIRKTCGTSLDEAIRQEAGVADEGFRVKSVNIGRTGVARKQGAGLKSRVVVLRQRPNVFCCATVEQASAFPGWNRDERCMSVGVETALRLCACDVSAAALDATDHVTIRSAEKRDIALACESAFTSTSVPETGRLSQRGAAGSATDPTSAQDLMSNCARSADSRTQAKDTSARPSAGYAAKVTPRLIAHARACIRCRTSSSSDGGGREQENTETLQWAEEVRHPSGSRHHRGILRRRRKARSARSRSPSMVRRWSRSRSRSKRRSRSRSRSPNRKYQNHPPTDDAQAALGKQSGQRKVTWSGTAAGRECVEISPLSRCPRGVPDPALSARMEKLDRENRKLREELARARMQNETSARKIDELQQTLNEILQRMEGSSGVLTCTPRGAAVQDNATVTGGEGETDMCFSEDAQAMTGSKRKSPSGAQPAEDTASHA